MDIKYIKVGKWYNVPFKVVEIKSGDIHMENGGIKAVCQPSELSEITTRQDVRSEHSTVGTLNSVERLEKLWNGMRDVLFDDDCQKYAEDLSKAMRNHIKSITPDNENGIKNTETAPKYDPNRLFRKGDKVHMKPEVNGRPVYIGDDAWEPLDPNEIWSVEEDELETGWVHIKTSCVHATVWHGMLELVTPVEEIEPYYIERHGEKPGGLCYTVHKHGGYAESSFYYGACRSRDEQQAKEAAESERDRLNAEYRKEQSNGLGH